LELDATTNRSGNIELSVKFDVSQFHAKYHPQQQPPNQLKLMLNSQTIGTVDINSGILVYRIGLKYLKEFDEDFLIFLGEPTISKFTIKTKILNKEQKLQ